MKLITTILLSTLLLIASQWLSQAWLLNQIHISHQSLVHHINSSTKVHNNNPIAFAIKSQPKNTEPVKPEASTSTIKNTDFEEKITLLIHKEINQALKNNTTSNTIEKNIEQETVTNEESTHAYYSALDIVSEAQSYGVWDESINMKLSPYKEKMTRSQKNLIVEQYIKAFNEGLISPNVSPPF